MKEKLYAFFEVRQKGRILKSQKKITCICKQSIKWLDKKTMKLLPLDLKANTKLTAHDHFIRFFLDILWFLRTNGLPMAVGLGFHLLHEQPSLDREEEGIRETWSRLTWLWWGNWNGTKQRPGLQIRPTDGHTMSMDGLARFGERCYGDDRRRWLTGGSWDFDLSTD
jgi:hypothetical protein